MSKGRKIFGIALMLGAFLEIIYYLFKIKGYASLDAGTLSDEQIAVAKKTIQTAVVISGFLLGGLLGAIVQQSKFCIAAACHNIVTTYDLTQTRAYAMALFVAIPATQLLYGSGSVDVMRSIYINSPFTWLSYISGGFIFGIGIVYAGGCASRILVRAGEGNLGGLVSVLAFIFSSGATLWGITANVRVDYFDKFTLNLNDQYLPHIIGSVPVWVTVLVIEAALLLFMLKAPKDSEWRGLRWPLAGAIGSNTWRCLWLTGSVHLCYRLGEGDLLLRLQLQFLRQRVSVYVRPYHRRQAFRGTEQVDVFTDHPGVGAHEHLPVKSLRVDL